MLTSVTSEMAKILSEVNVTEDQRDLFYNELARISKAMLSLCHRAAAPLVSECQSLYCTSARMKTYKERKKCMDRCIDGSVGKSVISQSKPQRSEASTWTENTFLEEEQVEYARARTIAAPVKKYYWNF